MLCCVVYILANTYTVTLHIQQMGLLTFVGFLNLLLLQRHIASFRAREWREKVPLADAEAVAVAVGIGAVAAAEADIEDGS